jgi:tripeptidyl-peptidase-1
MYWLSVLPVLAAVSLGLATPTSRWDDVRAKHSWDSIPEKWECQGHPPAGAAIDLRIALKPHRENALIDALYEVSDPRHSKYVSLAFSLRVHSLTHMGRCRYGAHLSKEQVAELVAPHPDTLDLVGSWLAYHEVPTSAVTITHGGGWLTIYKVPLTQANALLGATYQLYRHTETNETIVRTIGYALPAALHEHVQTVAPTTYFGSPRALLQTSRVVSNGPTLPYGDLELQNESATFVSGAPVPPSCSEIITPTCLRLLYKTLTYKPQATSKNKLGITGYLQQYASQSDLTVFLAGFRSDAALARFSVEKVNGGINDQNDPGVEVRVVLQVRVDVDVIYYHAG